VDARIVNAAPPSRPRSRRFEADDPAARAHDAAKLGEDGRGIGHDSQRKPNRRRLEACVVEVQCHRVADNELELDDVPGRVATALDHRRRQVDGDDSAERADSIGERRGQLAGASRDVDRRVAGPDPRSLDCRAPPAAVPPQRQDRTETVVHRGDLVEKGRDVRRDAVRSGGASFLVGRIRATRV
jgi:hypothetical protein